MKTLSWPRQAESSPVETTADWDSELHMIRLFLRRATSALDGEAGLFQLLEMINLKVKGLRCSLIRCQGNGRARVLASNDDRQLRDLEINLRHYPEIRELRRTLAPVIIPDVRSAELLRPVQARLENTAFTSLVLLPVFRCGVFFGALSLRLDRRAADELAGIEEFGAVCAQILSLAIAVPGQRLVAD
jgi:hypothetical protein